MAISAVPFALQNASHPANLFRQAVSSLVPSGGGAVSPVDFNVTQTGTPSMAVLVGTGRIWIPGTEVSNVSGNNYSSQAMYYAENDAPVTLTIATANATNPRIDVAYVSVNDQAYSGTLNRANVAIVTGTPSQTPVTPSVPNNALALATIAVAANAPSIVTANVSMIVTTIKVAAQQWDRASNTNDVMLAGSSYLATGTIVNAPPGQYRIDGYCGVAGNNACTGYGFVQAGTKNFARRYDLPTNTAVTIVIGAVYQHPGGNLVVSSGYSLSTGSGICLAVGNGTTSVIASFIG